MAEGNEPVFISNEQMKIGTLLDKISFDGPDSNGFYIIKFYTDQNNGFLVAFRNSSTQGEIVVQTIASGSLIDTHNYRFTSN